MGVLKILQGTADDEHFTAKDADPKQLDMGIGVEHEHTKSDVIAKKIALDHLAEIPDYYTRLEKMEKNAAQIEINTTPVIIAEAKNKKESIYHKMNPITRVASFIKARSKSDFIKKLIFREARNTAEDIANNPEKFITKTSSYLKTVVVASFNDEIGKINGR